MYLYVNTYLAKINCKKFIKLIIKYRPLKPTDASFPKAFLGVHKNACPHLLLYLDILWLILQSFLSTTATRDKIMSDFQYMAVWSLLKPSMVQIGISTFYLLNIIGVMESVLSLYPTQSWDTSILPVLSSYGEPFMDVVCRDSCDGHDVGRVSIQLTVISLRKYILPLPLKFPLTPWFHSTRLSSCKQEKEKHFPGKDIHSKSNFLMTVNGQE